MPYVLQSTGLVSTWIFDKTHNTLFDCGEGVVRTLRRRLFGIERIMLSHGHLDHTAGLFSLFASRASMKGDNEKPLDVYYPEGDRNIEALAACAGQILQSLPYRLSWRPISPGDSIAVSDTRRIECFPTIHLARQTTLGYRVTESRHRLKPEYRDDPEIEKRMRRMSAGEREAAQERYRQILCAYSGDSMPFDPSEIENASAFFMDATFLAEEDRAQPTHATLKEAIELSRAASVRRAWFLHLSTRYSTKEIREADNQLKERFGGAYRLIVPYATVEI